MSVTKSCRVPESVSERISAAAEEGERLESELLLEAIRLYEVVNPHGYAAFRRVNAPSREARGDVADRVGRSYYDPAGEF